MSSKAAPIEAVSSASCLSRSLLHVRLPESKAGSFGRRVHDSGRGRGLRVDDVDALHAEFVAKQVSIALEPTDQTWGNREMYVKDADGNSIRFTREGGGQLDGGTVAAEA
ncbi:MAG: VOC family protein [Acidobacteriota bacterium]